MSKIKMRCITCGKWFQSANAKEVTCPDCMQKARKEKMAAKMAPPTTNKTVVQAPVPTQSIAPPPPKPKPASGGTSHWLDSLSDVKVGEPEPPPKLPSSPLPREKRGGPERTGGYQGPSDRHNERPPSGYRESSNRDRDRSQHDPNDYRPHDTSGTIEPRPRQPMEKGPPRPARPPRYSKPGGKPLKAPKPPAPPKPKREKIPPPPPFKPTEEQIAQVETRYLELAVPAEFDGIRAQIAQELSIPKKAVKQIVKGLRERQNIPSWWELQTYKGDSEELAKIKALYEPYLPLPFVGVHKKIADELSLAPGTVYQAIKLIRGEMNLPQFNDPALHGLDLASIKKKKAESQAEAILEPHPTAEVEAILEPHPSAEAEAILEPHPSAEVEAILEPHPTAEVEAILEPHPTAEVEAILEPHPTAEAEAILEPHPTAEKVESHPD